MSIAREERASTGWLAVIREIAMVVTIYIGYSFTRGGVGETASIAIKNAVDIMHLERALGIFVELDIQAFVMKSSMLVSIANYVYIFAYWPSILTFAIWAYARHRSHYIVMRNAFLFSAIMGFICFALFPLAPPRLFPDLGFVDLMAIYSSINYEEPTFQSFYNPYAAMPSLHFGWTLLVGSGVIWIARHWWAKILGGLLPVAMLLAIVATGNHYFLDAVFGGVIVGIAFGLAQLFAKWRQRRTYQQ